MKLPCWLMSGVLVSALTGASAIERLPVEDFTREPLISRARLSLGGTRLAFLADYNGYTTLHVATLGGGEKIRRHNFGRADLVNDADKEVANFVWVSDERLVVTTTVWDSVYGLIATNWDGNKSTPISGWESPKHKTIGNSIMREIIHVYNDKDANILMLDRHNNRGGDSNRPSIVRMNTRTGESTTVVNNPGEVTFYGLDFDGVARFGILSHGEQSGATYRLSEKHPWQTIMPLKKREGQMSPLGLDPTNNRLFVTDLTKEKRWGVFTLDPSTGSIGEPLLSDTEYDIIPQRYVPVIDGVALAGPLFSKSKRSLIGIRYYNEAPRVKWFDQDYIKYQSAVDKALPNTVNLLVDQSQDGKKQLWLAFADRHPGEYRLLDLEKKTFQSLDLRMPWIKPEQMAPMLGIKYQARDGLVIHGYLTVPAGHQAKALPLVVMPHGGPWVRDVWGFNPLVQLIANRGYAVLQMNYRGSTGYGDTLYQEAKREIGGKIQDDIEDATRWAIAAGVADPKRIAIMGMSYGGYSTLFALGKNPELYCCGISFAGVTDWPELYKDSDVAENKTAAKYWREQIGDPDKDQARLRAISPVDFADKITAPVLIIQGKKDQRVPQDQAKRMIEALEKNGRKPESLFLARVGHNYGNEKERTEIFKATIGFLEKNLGEGVK